ncbi:phosphoenolpyruvate hydrolase family protein [Chloroflexota bacterium]
MRKAVSDGRPIIGSGAGTGISAKCEAAGGSDLIIIYNSGRYRMAGKPSIAGTMPFGDANGIIMEMAGEVLPVVKDIPVIAGVCAQDPFRPMDRFLKQLLETGFSGVQNFPTVGVVDGNYRYRLEHAGMGFDKEVEMIALARKLGLLTTPYAFDEEQAQEMAKAKADILVAHMGGTVGGAVGNVVEMTLTEAAVRIQRIHDAAKAVNPDILVICHGGPVAEPEDAEYILKNTRGVAGFYGASSMERLPVERAITEQVRKFRKIKF